MKYGCFKAVKLVKKVKMVAYGTNRSVLDWLARFYKHRVIFVIVGLLARTSAPLPKI